MVKRLYGVIQLRQIKDGIIVNQLPLTMLKDYGEMLVTNIEVSKQRPELDTNAKHGIHKILSHTYSLLKSTHTRVSKVTIVEILIVLQIISGVSPLIFGRDGTTVIQFIQRLEHQVKKR